MIEAIAHVAEKVVEATKVAEVSEVSISEVNKLKEVVLKPDVDFIKSTSLESIKDSEISNEVQTTASGIETPLGQTEFKQQIEEEISNKYFSTYEERLNRTPINGGYYDGERGESKFHTENCEANQYLKNANIDGIEYKNCIPDFSEVSKGNVEIPDMSESRAKNFRQADELLAAKRGCTPREVAEWREKNEYTWHECNDMKTCQKIPRAVNSSFGHLGGVSECKKFMMECDFDA